MKHELRIFLELCVTVSRTEIELEIFQVLTSVKCSDYI